MHQSPLPDEGEMRRETRPEASRFTSRAILRSSFPLSGVYLTCKLGAAGANQLELWESGKPEQVSSVTCPGRESVSALESSAEYGVDDLWVTQASRARASRTEIQFQVPPSPVSRWRESPHASPPSPPEERPLTRRGSSGGAAGAAYLGEQHFGGPGHGARPPPSPTS